MNRPPSSLDDLYQQFREPPTSYGLRPLWFWNAKLTPAEVRRQMEQLVAQGVYSAYVMAWSGLRPRYLSEEWWELVAAAIEKARELGFFYCFADEFNWPSGEARDYSLPGYPSRVLQSNPEFRMRSLAPEQICVVGPKQVAVTDAAGVTCAAAIHVASGETSDVTDAVRAGSWTAPEGEWHLYVFRLQESIGFDGGLVDLLNPEATQIFINLVYDEYYRRFPDDFGTTIVAARSDHEGDYGYRLAWTPRLFEAFRERKGYELVPVLPLLFEDGGSLTPKVRCDYFEVVSDLYAQGFLGQLAHWGTEHGIRTDGHVWEESLHAQAAFEGDHFAMQRAFGNPGIDSLFEWGRFPRHFLEARSVAHFRELPLVVEHQGVQGADSYLSPERAKRTTNAIAAWGTGVFCAHAMRADPSRPDFPEDWFESQPWWPFFHHYAEYVRRLAFMNIEGRHRCELAVYYPIETAWANGDPCFSPEKWDYTFTRIDPDEGIIVRWGNELDAVDTVYTDVLNRLPAAQWDLDIVDAHYLSEAAIDGGRLQIGSESFGTLILPPMTCMRLSSARRVRAFAESGGLVIAVGQLPTDSMENGGNDPGLAQELAAARPVRVADVDALLHLLEQRVPKDMRVVSDDPTHLFCSHRIIDERDCYWLVNDSGSFRRASLQFATTGTPERWDPDGGERFPLPFTADDEMTQVEVEFAPWQAYYVVFDQNAQRRPAVARTDLHDYEEPFRRNGSVIVRGKTHADRRSVQVTVRDGEAVYRGEIETDQLAPIALEGPWFLTPQATLIPVAYARTKVANDRAGLALDWHRPDYNDSFWPHEWLSHERFALRDWYVIGPFDYRLHLGWNEAFAPEGELDLDATYAGKEGPVRWHRYTSTHHIVDLEAALSWSPPKGGFGGLRSTTIYAVTHVWCPDDRSCELRIVGDANAKAWINGELVAAERDDHLGYLELNDAYAQRASVRLRQGWNRILAKVSQAVRFPGGLLLYARVCDERGEPLPDIVCSASSTREDNASTASAVRERWYRLHVPQSTSAVRLPGLGNRADVYVDGIRIERSPDDDLYWFDPGVRRFLSIRASIEEELSGFAQFVPTTAECPLGSWSHTGLSFFAGTAIYETEFELPPAYEGRPLRLDLGTVGVVAEVWLNGESVGERVWRPFSFEITRQLQPGTNSLRVAVTNTQANRRAQRFAKHEMWDVLTAGPELLDAIEENGLIGPVRIVPWNEVEIQCDPVVAAK